MAGWHATCFYLCAHGSPHFVYTMLFIEWACFTQVQLKRV